MSQVLHDHHRHQQRYHMAQTRECSNSLTPLGFDPQVNYWPELQPLRTHHLHDVHYLCTTISHLDDPQNPNSSEHIDRTLAENRPSKGSLTPITSLISSRQPSEFSTSNSLSKQHCSNIPAVMFMLLYFSNTLQRQHQSTTRYTELMLAQ